MTDIAYTDNYLATSVAALGAFAADIDARDTMVAMAADIVTAMKAGGKLMICGNGGSAGDSQHIAGEFISRLMFDHPPLPANPWVTIPRARASANAATTLGELPEVEIPSSTSPGRPSPITWRVKICSYP